MIIIEVLIKEDEIIRVNISIIINFTYFLL